MNWTVRFNSDKTSLCTKSFLLILNHFIMFRVDFRNNHRNIRSPSMCAIVWNYRCFCLSIIFFNLLNFFLSHINCTKYKINCWSNSFYFVNIMYNHLFNWFRHWSFHFPSVTYSIFISLSCWAWACSQSCNFKPWMVC